jgi:thiamine biosynthesis lipoprotein
VFGTIYNITYQSDKDLQQEIEAELMKVDGEFSMFNPQSTVARINKGDSTVERSEMFSEVYQLAQTVSKETDGAFDITVAPLVNAWGFGFKHEQMPTPEQVDSLLQLRNQMDFSAIAKGYGCDVVARLLESHGIHNYMVEIGGEVVVSGKNAKGDDWHIGITKPIDDSLSVEGEMQTVLTITDHAMATSGNYRNFYYQGGRKYAHTIDPRTGYPVQHSLLSATVLAENCATADAYATSFMVLGVEGAKAVLARHPELMAYLIYTDEKGQLATWATPSLSDYQ